MNGNRIASALLVAGVAGVVAVTWAGAPARHVEHVTAPAPLAAPAAPDGGPPANLGEAWSRPAANVPADVAEGPVALVPGTDGVEAVVPATGDVAWSYRREGMPLCAVLAEGTRAAAVFRGQSGCGEVTGLSLDDGSYGATRRSLAGDEVVPVHGGTRLGVRSGRFVELWRGDLVRTVGFGSEETPVRPGAQPYAGCRMADARGDGDLLAVIVDCGDGTRLVMQKAVPEESDEPEITGDVSVADGAHLVAVASGGVVIRAGGELLGYRPDASRIGARPEGSPTRAADPSALRQAGPWSLWFTGDQLVVFESTALREVARVPHAIGVGDLWGGHLLVPVRGGIAVTDPATGAIVRTIPVTRPDGRTDLRVVGSAVVERRPGEIAGLVPTVPVPAPVPAAPAAPPATPPAPPATPPAP
ncbi:hypothetical protein [Corynebacterium sp.]|uniref:Rv3212 family protein n=1 Tax=Corynebacterium sp. TaxID=1720 RepID=UPI0026DB63F8|nr:hypothetical protein [Corynebacterium sp.]MDO4610226.1 hypothetical protein [Corynebacterium sp.]